MAHSMARSSATSAAASAPASGSDSDMRIDRRIAHDTDERILSYARRRDPVDIVGRLHELDEEWSLERYLQAGAAASVLLGCVLAVTASRRWLLLPLGVAGFLLQHARQGGYPSLPFLRQLGVRTGDEINRERYALRQLLGQPIVQRREDATAHGPESSDSPGLPASGNSG